MGNVRIGFDARDLGMFQEGRQRGIPASLCGQCRRDGGDSDSGKAMGLQTIYFAYDAYTLTDEAKSILKANAQIMKDKPTVRIQVEGQLRSAWRWHPVQYRSRREARELCEFLRTRRCGRSGFVISFGRKSRSTLLKTKPPTPKTGARILP
jgi:hypothetical protein